MPIASMRVHVQPASHGEHHEQYSSFQSAMCKRWDTPLRECVPPFTHTVVQPFAGLSLENLQCRGRGTSLPDISECNAAELWQSGSRRDFSPAVAADASLTPSWTRADACPCPFSSDIERLAPSGRQRR